ncbi:MAG TPA: CYTH domain-containing protein [Deltaproteobacteria bacterium]|nr:CYTH domain-containing protein [Deltaproteobacteria bacterium]
MAQEIETTLAVVCSDPAGLMEEIAALRSLGPYRLVPGPACALGDTYYDTPSRLLSARGIALRTRELGEEVLFCIKQDERLDETGTAVRDEIELPWSRQCIDHASHILHKLASGINEVLPEAGSPRECLACLGLVPIQERLTDRLVLDASYADGPFPGTVAEMALDRVRYIVAALGVLHHEIEIEAKLPDDTGPVRELALLLRQRYPESLRPWRHNKLVTGFALERLMAEGRLPVVPGRYTHPAAEAYDAMDAMLRGLDSWTG